jgi:diacylglycerol kinase family enzyme
MASTPKIIVILNPVAGKGKALKLRPLIDAFLREKGLDYEIVLTERVGHALEIAQNCRMEEGAIVAAAGGDGTANEVANGLLRRKLSAPPVMAVLPIGRGNDFSCNAGVGDDLTQALLKLAEGKHYPLDAGMVRGGGGDP